MLEICHDKSCISGTNLIWSAKHKATSMLLYQKNKIYLLQLPFLIHRTCRTKNIKSTYYDCHFSYTKLIFVGHANPPLAAVKHIIVKHECSSVNECSIAIMVAPKQNTLQCSATEIHFTKIVLRDEFMHYNFSLRTISKSIFLIMCIVQCNLEFIKTESN